MGSLQQAPSPLTTEQLIYTPLTTLETTLNTLLTTLTTTPTYSGAPATAQSLLDADDNLTSALRTLHTHQANYAKILQLRAEAERLEERIKETVRSCVELRREIGGVSSGILSSLEEEEVEDGEGADADGEAEYRDVDYQTLLSFASKIGKYNAVAAKEAEEESVRRVLEAGRSDKAAAAGDLRTGTGTGTATAAADDAEPARLNGTSTSHHNNTPTTTSTTNANADADTGAATVGNGESASQTLIPPREREWLDHEAAATRAQAGMAFPAGEKLRLGLLGRLQWAREQGGEEAVERLVEEIEGKGGLPQEMGMGGGGEGEDAVAETARQPEGGTGPGAVPGMASTSAAAATAAAAQASTRQPQQSERKKSVVAALDLDLYHEDDEDED